MRLTNKTHYGFQLLAFLGSHPNEWYSLSDLSEKLDLPLSFLKHVASALKRHRILESQGGVRGGYRLSRPLDQISLAMVMKSLNEPIRLLPCKAKQCSHQKCITGVFWKSVNDNIQNAFDHTTLATLIQSVSK